MTDLTRALALAAAGAVAALTLKKYNPEFSLLTALAAGTVLLAAIYQTLIPLTAFWQTLQRTLPNADEIWSPLWKSVAVSLLSRGGAELCRDCEQNALASKMELMGNVTCAALMLPMLELLLELI